MGRTLHAVHLCIDSETLVWTDGGMRAISSLVEGERIVTGQGRVARVLAIETTPSDNRPWVAVHVWGVPQFPLRCTADHQILTSTGWKPAGDLSSKDWLLMPTRPTTSTLRAIDLTDHFLPRRSSLRNRTYQRMSPQTQTLFLTEESGWVLGMFLAESSVTKNGKMVFTLLNP